MHAYRARPSTGPQPVARPNDLMADRLVARHRTQARRRRIRFILGGLLVLTLLFVGVVLIFVTKTVITLGQAGQKIFQTPVAQKLNPQGTPVTKNYPAWGKPVNILLIGLDLRPGEQDTRADTQIVVHIDPETKTAAMVSIPRDLWVPIPGYGEGRINSAYQKGDTDKLTVPGGGPGLSEAAIEENFGVPIDYYAQVNFTGFEQIIDTLGGVTIDVPRPLADNEYPLSSYAVTRIYIPAGLQHMDGKTALEYARSRHADSDLGRNSRQQQVLLAVRNQGLNLNLITKLDDLAGQLSDAVKTDLSLEQVGSLAQLAKEIDKDSIQTVTIDANMVEERMVSGQDVLVPNWDLIKPRIAQAFADPKLGKEAARLSIQNGTDTGGIGTKVKSLLAAQGFMVADLRAAPNQGHYPVTTITDYTGGQKPHTIEALAKALNLNPADVKRANPTEAPVAESDGKPIDITIIVGDDKISLASEPTPTVGR